MPIDPFAALNAMLRAEAARCGEPAEPPHPVETDGERKPGLAPEREPEPEPGPEALIAATEDRTV
ncbi:hypothetical protein ACWEFL_19485 [Streptomyces sp. NPDC004838]